MTWWRPWPGADQRDRHLDAPRRSLDVVARPRRQVARARGTPRGPRPSPGISSVLGPAAVEDGLVVGEVGQALALARRGRPRRCAPARSRTARRASSAPAGSCPTAAPRSAGPPGRASRSGAGGRWWCRTRCRAPASAAVGVVELGGEGPLADAGDVGLASRPSTRSMRVGPIAGAGAGRAGDRVRGGHEGIGAVVDVEHRPLGALEQHPLAVAQRLVDEQRGVGDEGPQALGVAQQCPRPRRAGSRRGMS